MRAWYREWGKKKFVVKMRSKAFNRQYQIRFGLMRHNLDEIN